MSRVGIFTVFLWLGGLALGASTAGAPVLHPRLLQPSVNRVHEDPAQFWQRAVVAEARRLSQKSYIPYVWGGARIGSVERCHACRQCILSRQVPIKSRLQECLPCRQCGADCSHFVGLIFRRVGLPYEFATTWELGRVSAAQAKEWYFLVQLSPSRDLSLRPGDIVVHPRHMTMVLKDHGDGKVDLLEMTRFARQDGSGGIRIQKQVTLASYRGGVRRLYRHQSLHQGTL